MIFLPANINYTISKKAQVTLTHLRAEYSLTVEQAKELYNIDDLPKVIDELLAAGHVVFEIYTTGKETSVKAYTLCEFKDHDPKKLDRLTKTKQHLFSNDPQLKKAS